MSEPSQSRVAAGYFVSAILSIAIVAAFVVFLTGSDDGGPPVAGAFGQHYQDLEERRLAAGVPTMAEGGGEHFHPEVRVIVNGEEVPVPANIGVDPAAPPSAMAGLHTHDSSGTIHNEAGTGSTLGDFFAVWGVELSASRLGPYENSQTERVRVWVDGEPSRAFGDLILADGQEIVVAFGDAKELSGLP